MKLKGTTIEGVDIDVSAFKHGDTTVDFHINLSNIYGDPVRANSDHTFTAKVANSSGYIGDYPCAIDGTNLLIDSNEFFQLPPDSYSMEIWETWENDDGTQDTAIYPSPSKVLQFTINENIKDKTGEIVKRFDFQEAVENTVKSFLKNHPGSGDVDLRDYAKKSDIQRQLEDYAKKTELPKIVLDENSRVLDINGQELTIPESVDLSGYAKKGEVPQVTYDAEHRSLTVNGVAVENAGLNLVINAKTIGSDEQATVEQQYEDGKNYITFSIPAGKDGKTWQPYIGEDGNWHVKLIQEGK